MTLQGVDCDEPISAAALVGAGKQFVGRYIGAHRSGDLSVAEVADHHAHGIGILCIWEKTQHDLDTPAAANASATAAISAARVLGVSADHTVVLVLTCDNNTPPPGVESNMAGAAVILRQAGYLACFYGVKSISRNLIRSGRVDAVWPVDTWGRDLADDHWNYRQLPNSGQPIIGGVQCDIDDAPAPIGLWTSGSQPVHPVPTEDDDVFVTVPPDPTKSVNIPILVGRRARVRLSSDVYPADGAAIRLAVGTSKQGGIGWPLVWGGDQAKPPEGFVPGAQVDFDVPDGAETVNVINKGPNNVGVVIEYLS